MGDRVGRETGSVREQENESEKSVSVSKRDRERETLFGDREKDSEKIVRENER